MIAVKYDSEKEPGIDVSRKLRVNSWPTHILLDPDGKEVGRYVGLLNAEDFLTVMGEYKEGKGTIAYYEQKLETDPNNATAWKRLGIMYAEAREAEKCMSALSQYLAVAQDPTRDDQAEAFYAMAEVNYATGSPEKAVAIAEGMIQDYQDTQYFDPATTLLARSYYKTGETQKCIDTYMAYVNRYPDDPKALNSFAWFCASRQVGLDEALPIAIKAVDLTDRDPGYLDTLAELYYARGEYDLAIEIGQEAADKDPEDQYFIDQVKKFKKAKADGARASK
jgi:tetratricopeptide (TPR) repeat protein